MNLNNRDLIEAYIEYISASKNLSKNTIKSYKDDLVEFAKFLKFKEVKTIKEYELKKYINYLSSKFSPKSHSRKLSSLKGFFNYLFEFKIKDFNPVDIIEFPKLPKSLPIEFNFPNKRVELRVPINDGKSRLIIPKDGLIADGIEKLVYIVEKNKVKRKTVTLGQSFKDQIEIKSGVNEGDLVVIKGNENIRPNQSVKIKKNKK